MRIGVDFGTTNSSVAYYDGRTLHRIAIDTTNDNPYVLPSLIYVNREQKALVGTSAASEYLHRETGRPVKWDRRRVGEIEVVNADLSYIQSVHVMVDAAAHGRLLQSVKTALRDPSYSGTQVFDRFYTVDELIALLLRFLKDKAEMSLQESCNTVVIGRPVRFSDDQSITDRAEEIIFKAARLAGFEEVRFELEPVGAAYHFHRTLDRRKTAFVFDFGGGTLDLSVARIGGRKAPRVLATHGLLVGGDSLDRRVMQSLRKYFGDAPSLRERPLVPPYLLDLLDDWQTIPLLSRPHYVKLLNDLLASSGRRAPLLALQDLATRNLGFQLFRDIERAKRILSDDHRAQIDFESQHIHIHEFITRRQFEAMIRREIERVERGITETLTKAGLVPTRIDVVLRTGGTSAVPAFGAMLARIFGEDKIEEMDLLTSVVGGLAVVAHEKGGQVPRIAFRYPAAQDGLVRNALVEGGSTAEVYPFRVGAQCYSDSDYTLTRIPVELAGLPALRLAQADKSAAARTLQFDLTRPSRLFVALEATPHPAPGWVAEMAVYPATVMIDHWGTERMMRLYTKEMPAGRVLHHGIQPNSRRGNLSLNSLVIVQAT